MKKLAFLFILSVLFVWCNGTWNNTSSLNTKENISQETNNTSDDKKTPVSGKKKLVALMSTTCPHCNTEIPVLDRFYKAYKDRVDMQVIVVNSESNGQSKFAGNYQIPQETDIEKVKLVTYQALTGDACVYVPSFVIFSEKNEIEEKICWWALTYEQLEEKLLFSQTDSFSQTDGWLPDDLGVVMTTNHGKIEIKMFPNHTPKTVDNFLGLAQKWYYDGLIFHRVIKDFMIQWGDPNGNGTGGESIYGGKFEDEFHPDLKNIPGSLAMANAGPNTNGSQFFINQVDNSFLNNKHTVFGQVVNGMDVVEKIISQETNENDAPLTSVVIEKVEVVQYDGSALQPYTFDINAKQEAEKARQEANKNRKVKDGDSVKVHYILTTKESDEVIESSRDVGTPLKFVVSQESGILPAFIEAIRGMKINEKKQIEIPAKDAYGEWTVEVSRKELEDAMKEWWDTTEIKKWAVIFDTTILDVTDTTVTIENGHPLAGKTLKFELELIDILN